MSGFLLKNDRMKDYNTIIKKATEELGKLTSDHFIKEQLKTIFTAISRVPELNVMK